MEKKPVYIKNILILLLIVILFALFYFFNKQAQTDSQTVSILLAVTSGAVFLLCLIFYLMKIGTLTLIRSSRARKLLGILAAVFAIIAFGIFGFVSTDKRDIGPVEDSDLSLKSYVLSDQENAFLELSSMTANLKTDLDAIGSNTDWDVNPSLRMDAINNILSDNKIVLENFDRALNKKGYLPPEVKSSESLPLITEVYLHYNDPNLRSAYLIAKIQQLKVASITEKTFKKEEINHNLAFEEALKIIKFGDMLTKSPLNPSDYKVALDIKKIGLDTIRSVINDTYQEYFELPSRKRHYINYAGWSKVDYEKKASAVNAYKNSDLGAQLAVKKVYTDHTNMFKKGWQEFSLWDSGNTYAGSHMDLIFGRNMSKEDWAKYLGKGENFYFKPNKTISLQADIAREYLESTKQTCTNENYVDQYLPIFQKLMSQDLNGSTALTIENLKGKWAVSTTSSAFLNLNSSRCSSEVDFGQVDKYITEAREKDYE